MPQGTAQPPPEREPFPTLSEFLSTNENRELTPANWERLYQTVMQRPGNSLWTAAVTPPQVEGSPALPDAPDAPRATQDPTWQWMNVRGGVEADLIRATQESMAERLFRTVNGDTGSSIREEGVDMESIDTMVRNLIAHEVSSTGRSFITNNLKMNKRIVQNCTTVSLANGAVQTRSLPRGQSISEVSSVFMRMYFDGTLVFDDRIQFFLSDRAISILMSSILTHFNKVDDTLIEGFRSCYRRVFRLKRVALDVPQFSDAPRFSDFLAARYGVEKI